MAFFNNFGKKITNIGQSAVQKTKDVTDIARYNSAISEEERKITNLYCEIGKIYIQLHSQDPEQPLAEYVNKVLESEQKIAAFRKQILDTRGTIQCSACGAQVSSNSFFCNICGSKLQVSASNNLFPCPSCGKMLDVSTNFCNFCGCNVSNDSMPASANIQMNLPVNNSQDSSMIRCSKCGSSVSSSLNFCTMCGSKLDKISPPSVVPSVPEGKSPFARPGTSQNNTDAANSKPTPNISEKKTVNCENCGSVVEEGLKFCTVCGAKLSDKQSQNTEVHILESNVKKDDKPKLDLSKYSAGKSDILNVNPLNKPVEINKNPSEPISIISVKEMEKKSDNPPTATEIKCPKCGANMKSTLKFCTACGTKLNEDKPQEPKPDMAGKRVKEADKPIENQPEKGEKSSSAIPKIFKESMEKKSDNSPTATEIKCPKCGANMKSTLKFCTACGTKLKEDKPQEPKLAEEKSHKKPFDFRFGKKNENSFKSNDIRCVKCGSMMKSNLLYCTVCGSNLSDQQQIQPPLANSASENIVPNNSASLGFSPIPNQIPIPIEKKKCRSCNALLDANVRFCTECGAKMVDKENVDFISDANNSGAAWSNSLPFGKKKCLNCGMMLDENMRFCTSCGATLSDNKSTPKSDSDKTIYDGRTVIAINSDDDFYDDYSSQPTTVLSDRSFDSDEDASPPTINLDGQVCPNCKSIMASDMFFCTECGIKLK